jgi:hypothetical protein
LMSAPRMDIVCEYLHCLANEFVKMYNLVVK